MKDGFVVVATFWRVPEAGMAASFLRSAGLVVDVTDEGLSGVNPFLAPAIVAGRLRGPAGRAEKARPLLRERGLDGESAPADLDQASLDEEATSSAPAD